MRHLQKKKQSTHDSRQRSGGVCLGGIDYRKFLSKRTRKRRDKSSSKGSGVLKRGKQKRKGTSNFSRIDARLRKGKDLQSRQPGKGGLEQTRRNPTKPEKKQKEALSHTKRVRGGTERKGNLVSSSSKQKTKARSMKGAERKEVRSTKKEGIRPLSKNLKMTRRKFPTSEGISI